MTVFVIRDTLASQTCHIISSSTSYMLNYFDFPSVSPTPDWLKFVAAILDLEDNRFHRSPNNSLLSFSAPDWLRFI